MPRKPKIAPPPEDEELTMGDVFSGTAEDDAAEMKLGEAAKTIKNAHALAKEATNRLAVCRLVTSPTSAIRHDLERVVEVAEALSLECVEAGNQLGR